MTRQARQPRTAFTLIELMLVLVLLAVIAGLMVPSLAAFAAGRRTRDAATLLLSLANYARGQSAAEGVDYRLNFDAGARTAWLTRAADDGTYQPPPNDYGKRFTLPDGVALRVEVTPGSAIVPPQATDVTPATDDPPPPPFGQALATPNTLVTLPHADGGTYVQVGPGGRTDPCLIRLTGTAPGDTVDLGCATATDVIHVLKPGEM